MKKLLGRVLMWCGKRHMDLAVRLLGGRIIEFGSGDPAHSKQSWQEFLDDRAGRGVLYAVVGQALPEEAEFVLATGVPGKRGVLIVSNTCPHGVAVLCEMARAEAEDQLARADAAENN